jgi:hypothetical protein
MSVSLEERCAKGKKTSSSEGTLLERSAHETKRSFSGATRNPQHATHPYMLISPLNLINLINSIN